MARRLVPLSLRAGSRAAMTAAKGAAERGDNMRRRQRLNARGIKVIMLDSAVRGVPAQLRQPDGTHLTPEGYRALAAQLLPQVTAAIGGR
jgi:lysophospholipase L1-like esterase